jgi:hypothetical protein
VSPEAAPRVWTRSPSDRSRGTGSLPVSPGDSVRLCRSPRSGPSIGYSPRSATQPPAARGRGRGGAYGHGRPRWGVSYDARAQWVLRHASRRADKAPRGKPAEASLVLGGWLLEMTSSSLQRCPRTRYGQEAPFLLFPLRC